MLLFSLSVQNKPMMNMILSLNKILKKKNWLWFLCNESRVQCIGIWYWLSNFSNIGCFPLYYTKWGNIFQQRDQGSNSSKWCNDICLRNDYINFTWREHFQQCGEELIVSELGRNLFPSIFTDICSRVWRDVFTSGSLLPKSCTYWSSKPQKLW